MERQNLISELVDTYGYREPTDKQVAYCDSYIERNYFNKDKLIRDSFAFAAENDELKTIFSVKEVIRVTKYFEKHHNTPVYRQLEEREPTPQELEQIEKEFQQAIIREFNRYCKLGYYYLTPAYCYHYLEDKGIIETNYHQDEDIVRRAKVATTGFIKETKGYHEAKDMIKNLDWNMLGHDEKAVFKTKCMAIAFHQFFVNCRENKVKFWEKLKVE